MFVSVDDLGRIKPILVDYVKKSSKSIELQWDPIIKALRLSFDPYLELNREKSSHYFLQVAAIDTAELVLRSENARALMIYLQNALGEKIFRKDQSDSFSEVIQEFNTFYKLGPSEKKIPLILDSVNKYVENFAKGNLVEHAKKFDSPKGLVEEISENIPCMGGRHVDHSWMYMRWMTRAYPDLNIFKNFSIRDLEIPLTSFVRNVACCLGLCVTQTPDWSNPQIMEKERNKLTQFALELFPKDPAIVDYPFYVLGRWIKDEELNLQLLRDHLKFWQKIYDKIQRSPITFEVLSRNESSFEQEIREELEKLKVMFKFEPYLFQLPESSGIPHYKPDFVLPRYRKKGKRIILEPHGIWTSRQKRIVTIGKQTFPIWVFPTIVDSDEIRFVNKIRAFRKNYGNMYYFILIVPSPVRDRIERDYSDIYDEIYEGKDIPKMLYNITK